MSDNIFVTGTGIITSAGVGNKEVWESVLKQKIKRDYRKYKIDNDIEIEYPVYPIEIQNLLDQWVEPRLIEWMKTEGLIDDPDFILLLIAAKLALIDAGITDNEKPSISLIIGHENLGVNNLVNKILSPQKNNDEKHFFDDTFNNFNKYQQDFYKLQTFPYLFYLSKALGINGLSFVVNNACATGLYALDLAKMIIDTKQSEAVVVATADYAHVTEHLWLEKKGFISPSHSLKPFDKNRDGSILGDGASAVLLESSSRTIKTNRMDKIKCRYVGSQFSQDNWRMTVPDVTKHTYSKLIENVINSTNEIDLLVPHGAGIPMWDHFEAKEIKKAFINKKLPKITLLKEYFGHTLGANALLESIILIHCINNNIVPPVLQGYQSDETLGIPLITKLEEQKINRVMKTVTAYGGFQAVSIFERFTN